MRKKITKFVCALMVLLITMPALRVEAATPYTPYGRVPYSSWGYWQTDDAGKEFGHFYMQTPYVPSTSNPVLGNPLYDAEGNSQPGFEIPEDLYIDSQDYLYVVDSRQKRAVKMTNTGQMLVQYGDTEGPGVLNNPCGIYVSADFEVYVCDTGNNRIAVFSNEGVYQREILKPDDPILKDVMFLPERISIDTRGIYMVVCRGVNQGMMQITPEGEFKGFFGANIAQPGVLDKLKAFFYSYEQREASQVPAASISDVFIDSEGYIYTATTSLDDQQIKKFNVGSENLFKDRQMDVFVITEMMDEWIADARTNFRSVCVDVDGNIYALDSGYQRIFMFDRFGEPVFSFGQRMWDPVQIVVGTLANPTSIRVDSQRNIYVTDRVYKGIMVYTPTEYAKKLININYLYNDGRYDEAETYALDVLKDNVYVDKANIVLGKYHFNNREWEDSMDFFKKAKNPTEYSEAFWEWRLTVVQKYFAYAALALVLIIFGVVIKNIIVKKRKQKTETTETGGSPL